MAGAQSLARIIVNPLIGRAVEQTGSYDAVALVLGSGRSPLADLDRLARPRALTSAASRLALLDRRADQPTDQRVTPIANAPQIVIRAACLQHRAPPRRAPVTPRPRGTRRPRPRPPTPRASPTTKATSNGRIAPIVNETPTTRRPARARGDGVRDPELVTTMRGERALAISCSRPDERARLDAACW